MGRFFLDTDDRFGKFGGGGQVESPVHIGQMFAIDLVELHGVVGGVFRAIPPVPVAALGDENFLHGLIALGFRHLVRVGRVGFPGGEEEAPGLVVFLGTEPDVEVGVDPGAGSDVVERCRGETGVGFRHGDGLHLRIGLDTSVEGSKKGSPAAFVVFPGIFAVQDDGDHRVFTARQDGGAVFFDPAQEVSCGLLRVHAGINEPNQVAQQVVAEDHAQAAGVLLPAVGSVGEVGTGVLAEGPGQHAIVGGCPLKAGIGGEGEGLVGDGTF